MKSCPVNRPRLVLPEVGVLGAIGATRTPASNAAVNVAATALDEPLGAVDAKVKFQDGVERPKASGQNCCLKALPLNLPDATPEPAVAAETVARPFHGDVFPVADLYH